MTPSTRRRHRAAVSVLLAASTLTGTVSACTRPSTTPPSAPTAPLTPTTTTTTKAGSVDPQAVLEGEADRLRSVIDGLLTFAAVEHFRTGDEATPCALGQQDPWPKSWNYSWRLDAGTPDSRPLARRLTERLQQQGWRVAPFGDPDGDEIRLLARKDGAGMSINAGSTGGGIAIVGTSACVGADGSVRAGKAA